ncbi:three component ABC system middle component [Streptomyces chartreusis]|uniref:three component ABC system middle component n=1 Tax=Streptomyces chartreusis TaxID=1969 RepID=UPI001E48192B|nr:three component ABC system middle component [Streptomyces chartreusis]
MQQPQAFAAFLNPALVGALQAVMAREYELKRGRPMAWPLAMVLPVLVLHRSTREALPPSIRTHLPTWAGRNPALLAGFGPRVDSTLPVLREGLRFALRHGIVQLEAGAVYAAPVSIRRAEGELQELMKAARLVGKWAATVDQPSTLLALLGVRV